jgi:large subunit ribosomal protein L9
VGQKLDGKSFIIIRQAGDTGQLYGSVSTRDIADQVVAGGTTIVRGQVILDRPIKSLGLHPIRVSLHPEVAVTITINVARTADEAERQARGEDVTADRFEEEEEETVAVEELFEEGAAKPVTEDEETGEAEADRD